jgi:8-oxo-dGTP pyrophosphatase MutT (NUDIX family)
MIPSSDDAENSALPPRIRIAAAIIKNARGHILLVRKHGTQAFIQPGGKIEPGESPVDALTRELKEELNCIPVRIQFCGQLSAPAVNEPGHLVEALIYHVGIDTPVTPAAEIAEIVWLDPTQPSQRPLAPLTRDGVLKLAQSQI